MSGCSIVVIDDDDDDDDDDDEDKDEDDEEELACWHGLLINVNAAYVRARGTHSKRGRSLEMPSASHSDVASSESGRRSDLRYKIALCIKALPFASPLLFSQTG
jgi:hypothetical protein